VFIIELCSLFDDIVFEMKVVAYDFGVKYNILRRLKSYGCNITVVPSTWPASETLKMKPDGILFSNGPGDPSAVPYAVETVKELIGKVPIFGICMGHQLLGQALGGKTFKMKFGHHGGNHPVRNILNGQVEISSQVGTCFRTISSFSLLSSSFFLLPLFPHIACVYKALCHYMPGNTHHNFVSHLNCSIAVRMSDLSTEELGF